jgi:glycosyltransferase involved in cell wall biosynthesis
MLNVLMLSELFYPHGGGAEYATFLYAKLLSQAGFNIIVVTNRFSGESKVSRDERLTVYRLPLLGESGSVKYAILKRFDVLFSSLMRKMMKWADVVYIPRFWFSAIPLAKVLGKPIITHLHDYIPICPLAILYDETKAKTCDCRSIICSPKCIYAYEKTHDRNFQETLTSVVLNSGVGRYLPKFIELSDAIICVSKSQRSIIVEKQPSLRKNLHIIYNPLPKFSTIEINGDDFGYFGGPDVLKGFRVLYHALSSLNHAGSRLMRIHCTKFQAPSERVARALSGLGFVLYDKLDKSELDKVYENIRAVVVPSVWHEPWPYVVVEALVQGRFVVTSSVGGIPEQVEGCNGVMLFEAGNYNELADSMEFVAGLEREKIVDFGCQNRETFLRRFDNESSIKGFISVCEHLI